MILINGNDIDFNTVLAVSSNNESITLYRKNKTDIINWKDIDKQIDELDHIYLKLAEHGCITLSDITFKSTAITALLDKSSASNEYLEMEIYLKDRASPIKVEWSDTEAFSWDLEEFWTLYENLIQLGRITITDLKYVNNITENSITIDKHDLKVEFYTYYSSEDDFCSSFEKLNLF